MIWTDRPSYSLRDVIKLNGALQNNGHGPWYIGYSGDNVRQKFTSYERDTETNLDFAQARYYASTQGRFTSVDPLMASAEIGNPQSFNRYSYALNSPSNNTDPSRNNLGDGHPPEMLNHQRSGPYSLC